MNRDDVIRMAREAGFTVGYGSPVLEKLERFAQLVAAHEREECAKVCKEIADAGMALLTQACANTIRARSSTNDILDK